jgi:hypothetical protein
VRFIVGIILAIDVLRAWVFGGPVSFVGNMFAGVFLILSALYLIFKF